jgi:hypothetical protein
MHETTETIHKVLGFFGLSNSIVGKIADFIDEVSKVGNMLVDALSQHITVTCYMTCSSRLEVPCNFPAQ